MPTPDRVALDATAMALKPPYAKAEVTTAEIGATRFDGRGLPDRIEVPTGYTPGDRVVRLHEAYHALLGPLAGPVLESQHCPLSIQAVEDMLIHHRILANMPPEILDEVDEVARNEWKMARMVLKQADAPSAVRNIAKLMQLRAAATLTRSGRRTKRLPPGLRNLRHETPAINRLPWLAHQLLGSTGKRRWSWLRNERSRRHLEEMLRDLDVFFGWTPPPKTPPPPPPEGSMWKSLRDMLSEDPFVMEDTTFDLAKLDAMTDVMQVIECTPRTMPTALAKRRTKYRARSGRKMDPKRLPRAIVTRSTDGLFIRRRKADGAAGTILIDASGSMCIDMEMLEEMVTMAPGATIAIYAGRGDDASSRGQLFVLARDGKLCKAMPDHGGGNSVDYWALKWLLQQPGPHTYVGDLEFCGGPAGQARAAFMLWDRLKTFVRHFDTALLALDTWKGEARKHRRS